MEPEEAPTVTRQIRLEPEDSDDNDVPEDAAVEVKYEKAYLVRELMDQFVGMGRDDGDTLCDIHINPLSCLSLDWFGKDAKAE